MAINIDDVVYKAALQNSLVAMDKLSRLLKEAADTGLPLMSVLLKHKEVNEPDLLKAVAKELNLEYVLLKNTRIDKQVIEAIPYRFAWHYKFVPVKIDKNILTIAVSAPPDIKTQDELRLHFGYEINVVFAGEADILDTLVKLYGLGADTIHKIMSAPEAGALPEAKNKPKAFSGSFSPSTSLDEVEDIEKLAGDASVIKLVNQIISEAYKKRATDIHIEPYRNELRLRYRIDGILYDANASPQIKHFLMPILSRIKIMSNLNIVERRLPQDGRAIVKTQDQVLDLRISFMPTPYGESVAIRILPAGMIFSLEELGLSRETQVLFESLILRPHGIIFVTGPTGSGKTTTLYACLTKINKKEKKIITIEDPIEYEIPGITQIQVNPDIGLTFSRGLRSMLRHDPDIMMVGEVRDLETAEIAIRVALTGHLVFSTIHTNNAASGVTRLIDIGVEPYLIASSVDAFIAQRLIRVICPHCKKEDLRVRPELKAQIAKELSLELGQNSHDSIKIYRGDGCERCNFTGYYGRSAIFEILVMDETIRDMILKKPSSEAIKRIAVATGMRTLRQDGWNKVISGITTPEEIIDVTQDEQSSEPQANFFEEKIDTQSLPDAANISQAPQAHYDKRVFLRLNARIPIHWKVCPTEDTCDSSSLPEFMTTTKNLSAGGLLFLTKEPLSAGVILELRIDLPQDKVTCLAKVVRIEEVQGAGIYKIAVCFLDLSGADRAKLNNFIAVE